MDDFEDVAVDRLPEEEALEGGRTKRIDQYPAGADEARLQRREVRPRMEQRHVAAELSLIGAGGEAFHVEDVHLLPPPDVEPERFDRRVAGHGVAGVPECLLEERGGAVDVAPGQGQMRKAHPGIVPSPGSCRKPPPVGPPSGPPGPHRQWDPIRFADLPLRGPVRPSSGSPIALLGAHCPRRDH